MIVKRQNKKDDRYERPKMQNPFKNEGWKVICETMAVEIAPDVIQTIAATAPKIFILMRRWLKGTLHAFAPKK